MRSIIASIAYASVVAASIVVSQPAAAKAKPKITHLEDGLIAAGFEAKPANTPAKQAMLTHLPNEKFVQRVNGDMVAYVYADPKHCNCFYMGTEQDYGKFRKAQQTQEVAEDRLEAAQDYQDSSWDWGLWGPWGGRWGGFGFGYGW